MFDGKCLLIAIRYFRDRIRNRFRQQACGGNGHRAEHTNRPMADVRNKSARAYGAAITRFRYQAHLRHSQVRDIAEIHQRSKLAAQRFESGFQFIVRFQFLGQLVAAQCKIRRAQHHDRHAIVDTGRINAVNCVYHISRRQQLAAGGACDVQEIAYDRRGRAGNAVDFRVSIVVDDALGRFDSQFAKTAAVNHMHAYAGDRRPGGDKSGFDRERADTCQYVAAVLHIGGAGLLRNYLQEQVVNVSIVPFRRTDDGHLVRQGMTAADAVNLHIVRPAHDLQQDPVTRRLVVWQVRAAKVDAAGGTATKYDARYCSLAHSHFFAETFDE